MSGRRLRRNHGDRRASAVTVHRPGHAPQHRASREKRGLDARVKGREVKCSSSQQTSYFGSGAWIRTKFPSRLCL